MRPEPRNGRLGRIRAVLWDIDGVLVDSEDLHYEALGGVCERLGYHLSPEENETLIGLSFPETWLRLSARHDFGMEESEWIQEIIDRYRSGVTASLLREGVPDVVRGLAQRGIRQAAVSTAPRALAQANLLALGKLAESLEIVVAGEDVGETKPHPAPYLRAMKALGMGPDQCIAVEDSQVGVAAGKSSGALTLAWPNEVTRRMDFGRADEVLEHLDEFPWHEVGATLRTNGARPVATSENARLRAIDRDRLIWADTVHYQKRPVLVERHSGDRIWDSEGHVYTDTHMWHSSCNFGYRNPDIEAAVAQQLVTRPQVNGDLLHPEKLELAERVVDAMYQRTGLKGRVSFNIGGALVVEDALKVARKHSGKNRVGVFMGAYHGRSLGTLSLSSSYRYREAFGEFADRALMFPFATCGDCFYGKQQETCGTYCGQMVKRTFDNEFFGLSTKSGSEIGAFVVEPIQGRGYQAPPPGFFTQFVPELKKRGILLISDEIQVGMYRSGKLFAFEHFDYVPDMVTLGKSFTNGMSPLGVLWVREGLAEPEHYGPGHAHSNFANHSLGTAAALAAWTYMLDQDYGRTVPEKGAYVLGLLEGLRDRHAVVSRVEGLGLLLNLTLCRPDGSPWPGVATRAVEIAQDEDHDWQGEPHRLILCPGGYNSDMIKLAPWLDSSTADLDRIAAVLDQVLTRLAE